MSIDESRSVVRSYFDDFHNGRNDSVLADIITGDLLPETQRATERLRIAFPDYSLHIEEMVAGEDLVATVWTATGTHKGQWDSPIGPVPATGKQITWTGTTTLRVEGGKIVDVIGSNWDHLGILQQLGVVATTQPRSGA